MKKTLLIAFTGILSIFSFAQTATNWTVNDCNNVNHTLFSELDAGKVVVITWPMPCGICIAPTSTAANTVIGFANPNVVFYIVDDYANTTCGTLNTWASTNSITANATFSNSAISMTDYGTAGMPKTVVLGGTSHSVFFNVNGTVSQTALQTAINNALASTGVNEISGSISGLNLYPNPVSSTTTFSYTLANSTEVNVEIFDMIGQKVMSIESATQSSGSNVIELDLASLNNGVYFVRINDEMVKFVVSH